VLAAQFVVLNVSPSFFNFYSGFVAGTLALTIAAAVEPDPVPDRRPRWLDHRVGFAATAIAAAVTLSALVHSRDLVDPFPAQRFERATAGLRCVMTDADSALILMNRLSQDLRDGCPNWVDVTGHTYFGSAKSMDVPRGQNQRWQRLVRPYLLSGDAVLTTRHGTGLSHATRQLIASYPVLARGDHYVLHRVDVRP
jgi:alpha-1,2-mannosyltransferase